MNLNSISIRELRQKELGTASCYGNHIIITNHAERLEPFRYPCRTDAHLLLVCLDGSVDFSINLRRYCIGSNTVVVALAGDIIQIHHTDALEAYAVLLSTDYLDDLQIDFRQRSSFYLGTRRNAVAHVPRAELKALMPYYELLKENMEKHRQDTASILRGLVQAFSYTIISLMQLFREEEEAGTDVPTRNHLLFDKFMALLQLHHTQERSLSFYADRLCLTPNYLSGTIKEYSGKSASEWINEYVVLEAKILLKHTDLSVQEIAYRLNFTTQSAFGKYFKIQTGVGPKAYRQG